MKRSFFSLFILIMTILIMSACGGSTSSTDDSPLAAGGGDSDLPGGGPSSDGLSEEEADAIATALDSTSYDFDADGQTLTITSTITEDAINTVISKALEAAGYGSASVDLVSGGMIVTITDFTYEDTNYGDVIVTADVGASGCEADVTITDVSVDGTELPDGTVDELNDTLEEAWNSAIDSVLSSADLPDSVDVCLTDLTLSDTDASLTIVFSW